MKKLLILVLCAAFFTPFDRAAANSDMVDIELAVLYFVKNHCERKLLKCINDRDTARALVRELKNTPHHLVEAKCTDICTSPSEIRNTKNCTDDQCDDRCDVTGGLDDAYFLEIIELRRYEELQIICK